MGASGLDGPGVVVGSIVGLVLAAKKRSRNGRWPNQILQVGREHMRGPIEISELFPLLLLISLCAARAFMFLR